jgi:orotate phosphoribosyltransferase
MTLSFPEVRGFIRDSFAMKVRELYPGAELIAGVATGALLTGLSRLMHSACLSIYVRSGAKDHGLGNQKEGIMKIGQKVVVIEDLISTAEAALVRQGLREAAVKSWG